MIAGVIEFVGAAAAAFTLGTFGEYFVHRAMHWGLLYPEGHRWHHESNEARTFAHDFWDYGGGPAALCWLDSFLDDQWLRLDAGRTHLHRARLLRHQPSTPTQAWSD